MNISTPRSTTHPVFLNRIVTDEDVARALDWLRDSAMQVGAAREAMIKAQRLLEHTEALLVKSSEATSDIKRKADARTDPRWLAAALDEARSAGEYEKMRALREAASARIEAWRSEAANIRGMRV